MIFHYWLHTKKSYIHGPVENGRDVLLPEPLGGTHHHNLVLDGKRIHVVQKDVVGLRQKCWLAAQRGVLVQDHLCATEERDQGAEEQTNRKTNQQTDL